uniref:Uncharacterized protein n=1 Tax=Triticum urartu TaxID=4572 RepID=A0A8R7P8C8_TRIUA
ETSRHSFQPLLPVLSFLPSGWAHLGVPERDHDRGPTRRGILMLVDLSGTPPFLSIVPASRRKTSPASPRYRSSEAVARQGRPP